MLDTLDRFYDASEDDEEGWNELVFLSFEFAYDILVGKTVFNTATIAALACSSELCSDGGWGANAVRAWTDELGDIELSAAAIDFLVAAGGHSDTRRFWFDADPRSELAAAAACGDDTWLDEVTRLIECEDLNPLIAVAAFDGVAGDDWPAATDATLARAIKYSHARGDQRLAGGWDAVIAVAHRGESALTECLQFAEVTDIGLVESNGAFELLETHPA